jgi:hypothetical protein
MSIPQEPQAIPEDVRSAEQRWPMALAAISAMVLHQYLPVDFRLSPHWLYPVLMVVFLGLLVLGDPGRIDEEHRWLRVVTNAMIVLIVLSNLVAAGRLIRGIFDNAQFNNDAYQLLGIGTVVWITNVIAFALWFWDVDGGGSAVRARRGAWADPAFVFPEMQIEKYLEAGWYPRFADYLVLSFYTATAFSATDVSAIKRWAKLIMVVESAASLAVVTLVVAKAINAL